MYTTIYRSWYAQKKPSPRLLQPAALLLAPLMFTKSEGMMYAERK